MRRKSTNKKLYYFLTVVVLLGIVFGLYVFVFKDTEPLPIPNNAPYKNTTLPVDERVADLMSHMTLEEKIGQMALVEKNSVHDIKDVSTYGLGGMLSGFGGKPANNTADGWERMVDAFVSESRSSRLTIPILYGVDAIHGHSNVPDATIFPHMIGLGASGDATLVEDVARATANELLATGIRWSYSPTYDMPEDIRWGRVYESFSDDPALVGKLGSAYIRGLQESSDLSSTISVLATPKHYIGAGGMLWNTSSNENFKIDQGTTPSNEQKLRKHYLQPFKEAVDAGALSVMVGLNSWGDTKLAASPYLITDVLKGELSFKGFVVSDWYGVYEIPGSDYAAAVTAINAGVDMVMLPFEYQDFARNIRSAVFSGEISELRINDAVERILTAKFRLGLFDETHINDGTVLGSPAHRMLARDAVSKSLVLLKNDAATLPLKQTASIRVAGSAADNVGKQSGAWTVEWQGIDGNWLPSATSILTGIREVIGDDSKVEFDAQAHFATSTPKADIGIAVVGESPYAEGWGDNAEPRLSAEDIATIARLRETSAKVVVVLVTGRPLIITKEMRNWDAVVVAWLPGSEGAGVADVLFGAKKFTGTLPLPWPSNISQLPIVAGKTRDGSVLLFPRYFGLRY